MGNRNNVKMTVYEIHYAEQNIKEPDLCTDLFKILNTSNTIRERLMPLTQTEDNTDSDFITSFKSSGGFLFGSFARLTAGEESVVPKAALDKKAVSLNEMISETSSSNEGFIKASSFFCVYKNLLILTNRIVTLKALQSYVNWLMEKNGFLEKIIFLPKKNTATEISIKEIKSVEIADGYINSRDETKSQSMTLTNQLLRLLLDVKGKKDFDEENLISAKLTLKFKQKEINKEKSLDTALKIIDDENITVIGKNGRRIRGSEYLITAVRKIEKLESGIFNEQEIETEMRQILKDINNGKMVS
ncbi:hypothetical protein [uncultured Treponema sp.]|uniref:hypothetical protein n=1 Tax=uncultured Treponema sp. TaxID=162155 RepID=UPI002615E6A6|nr:hypothetical protein [uncultured Treponema sp.]